MFKEQRAGPPLLRLMYIAETQINHPFTDVTFRRDSEEDVSGHVPPSPGPVPSAHLDQATSAVYLL